MSKILKMLAVGDVILETRPPADWLFDLSAPILKSADVLVGHGEVLFTDRGNDTYVEMTAPAKPCSPENMNALSAAGFNIITLAGNHTWDSGAPGIEDTVSGLAKLGISPVGAGMNIAEARRPAIIEREGTKFGFLDYNCVGPRGSWAASGKPGCAYVGIITHYELKIANPSGPPVVYSFAEPVTLAQMQEDIQRLRRKCDVLVVSLHKGVLGLAKKIADYDRQVAHSAIDSGADLILGQHAHILQGIESYKGKYIFHGMGNFVMYVDSFTNHKPSQLGSRIGWWAEDALQIPQGAPPPIPQGDARKTLIAKCLVDSGEITKVCYIPCLINDKGQPEVLKHDEKGEEVFNFIQLITKAAGFNITFRWENDEVVLN
jgi:hypothetical protein